MFFRKTSSIDCISIELIHRNSSFEIDRIIDWIFTSVESIFLVISTEVLFHDIDTVF